MATKRQPTKIATIQRTMVLGIVPHRVTPAQPDGDETEENGTGNGIPQTCASPTEAQQEIEHVADGQQVHTASIIETVGIGTEIHVGISGIDVAYAGKGHSHLDDYNNSGKDSDTTIKAEARIKLVEPI